MCENETYVSASRFGFPEDAVGENMRDLFEGDHTLLQDAHLVYDVLWKLDKEGFLKKELRRVSSNRERYFMWID